MTIGRNEKCHCGSNLKYKKCCLNKDTKKDKSQEHSLESVIAMIKFGLQNLDILKGSKKKVRVKEIKVINNDSIVCEFYPYSSNSIDIKLEVATIIGFFYGFLKDDVFPSAKFGYYSSRAFDENDNELLYSISSKESAKQIGNGNSLDWMKSTIFQENTDDYRLGIAKKIISEIETTLRTVIHEILLNKHGDDWWNICLNNKLGNGVKETYKNQFGIETKDGSILVKYTYTLQLKKIISTFWPLFKHLFASKNEFESSIDKLNIIRREEAHNRTITKIQLDDLDKLYIVLLSKICEKYPDIVPTYLVEGWRSKVKLIMSKKYKPIYSESDQIDEEDSKMKLMRSILSTKNLIQYIDDKVISLNSLVVPIQKRILHNKIVFHFNNYKNLLTKKLELINSGEVQPLLGILKEIDNYSKVLDEFAAEFLLSEA